MKPGRGELLLLAVLIGCGRRGGGGDDDNDDFADGDADSDGDADAEPDDCSNAPPMAPFTRGRGQVTVDYGLGGDVDPYLRGTAEFFETEPPVTHEEIMREGDCALMALSCDGVACSDPALVSAGVIELSHGGDTFTLEQTEGAYYGSLDVSVRDYLPVAVEASGGEVPSFSVEASIPEDLYYVPIAALLQIRDDEDARITWERAFVCNSRVRLTLRSDGGGEGSLPDRLILCDVPDQGHLEIPRALIQSYPEQHRVSDYFSSLMRYTYTPVTAGDVEVGYWVASHEGFLVEHNVY